MIEPGFSEHPRHGLVSWSGPYSNPEWDRWWLAENPLNFFQTYWSQEITEYQRKVMKAIGIAESAPPVVTIQIVDDEDEGESTYLDERLAGMEKAP